MIRMDAAMYRLFPLATMHALAASFVFFISALPAWAQDASDPRIAFFETKVRPLFVEHCYNCHSADHKGAGGLRVDDYKGLLEGGNSGPAVVPGDPKASRIIAAVRHEGKTKMPPEGDKLTDEQIADLEKWIVDGAVWPSLAIPANLLKPDEFYEGLRKEHWAWQPLRNVAPPQPADATWARDDVDRFVLAKLEEKGLKPTTDADKLTLIRRIKFDLTGLPPTVEEIDSFLADASPKALESLVDRLLASKAFGERWGRHWLDVARYGESTGSARNVPYPHAWRYRDYVIDSVNADKPYDQFIREQIAGDLLPANSPMEKGEQLVATGFLALGVKDVNQRFPVRFLMDNVDEQIDTVSRGVLALTVSCARCHDHKFDPVPTADYYALAGIFRSTDLLAGVRSKMGGGGLDYYDTDKLINISTDSKPDPNAAAKIEELTKALAEARAAFQALQADPNGAEKGPDGRPKRQVARQKMNKIQQELSEYQDPAVLGKVAYGVRDSKKVSDTEVRIRGEAEKLGPVVPRGYLTLVSVSDAERPNPKQSGRLELAQWLTSTNNPLTTRVYVNRVWQHLFGDGLVKTVDNFGTTGETPSNPELLDHLAKRFVQQGWSTKALIKSLVLSRAYQLSSDAVAANVQADPANRLVWRHSPRRLDAEELRDAALVASNMLTAEPPKGSLGAEFKVIEVRNNGPEARKLLDHALADTHRSVYLPLFRGITPTSLASFDFAEQGMPTGKRDTTTVATQALYLLNDPFVRRSSIKLAENVLARSGVTDMERISHLYVTVLGRPATANEIVRAREFLASYQSDETNLRAQLAAEKAKAEEAAKLAKAEADAKAAQAPSEAATAPVVPANPDDIADNDQTARDDKVEAADPRIAAWASFCQALLGSAEARYVK